MVVKYINLVANKFMPLHSTGKFYTLFEQGHHKIEVTVCFMDFTKHCTQRHWIRPGVFSFYFKDLQWSKCCFLNRSIPLMMALTSDSCRLQCMTVCAVLQISRTINNHGTILNGGLQASDPHPCILFWKTSLKHQQWLFLKVLTHWKWSRPWNCRSTLPSVLSMLKKKNA